MDSADNIDIRGEIFSDIMRECKKISNKITPAIHSYITELIDEFILKYETEIFEIRESDAYEEFLFNTKQLINDRIITEEEIEELSFVELFEKSQRWISFYSKFKKTELRIVIFGRTQVGKTAAIKNIFNLKNLELKGNTGSSTSEIKEYVTVTNGIKLIFCDTPGYYDSENNDGKNFSRLKNFFVKNDVHLILWFSKIGDIIDASDQAIIKLLNREFGTKFWKHTVVVLTHANNTPPQEYFSPLDTESMEQLKDEEKEEEDEDDIFDFELVNVGRYRLKRAWCKYVQNKTDMWLKYFKLKLNVVLIENNKFHHNNRVSVDGDRLLIDDRPMWENLMLAIIDTVADEIKPFAFMALAGNINKTKISRNTRQKILKKAVNKAAKSGKCCTIM